MKVLFLLYVYMCYRWVDVLSDNVNHIFSCRFLIKKASSF